MTKRRHAAFRLVALGLFVAVFPYLGTTRSTHAHHSFSAVFDPDAPIELSGIVTEVEWMNPHVWIYIDVIDGQESAANWAFELGSTTGLRRSGWSRDTVQVGQEIKVSGYRARDGSRRGNASSITLADGTEITGYSSRTN